TLGLHTVNLWMREDGTVVDKLLLTTNAAYTPTGLGPTQSPPASGPVKDNVSDASARTTTAAAATVGDQSTALRFDGVVDDVRLANSVQALLSGTATVAFWIRSTQVGQNTLWQAPAVRGVEWADDGNDIFSGWLNATGREQVSVDGVLSSTATSVARRPAPPFYFGGDLDELRFDDQVLTAAEIQALAQV
ncbi:MAG: hypothetical protein L0Z62_48035, partial [Gemmataceae bacterium]|nr:hypothetical protein [Gemmataceae bacterium]